MRLAALLGIFALAACSSVPMRVVSTPNYVSVRTQLGCINHLGDGGAASDQLVVLTARLERHLYALLAAAEAHDAKLAASLDVDGVSRACWYETPDQKIRLEIGDICASTTRVDFGSRGEDWEILKIDHLVSFCHEIRR